jgi:hypothetical protein
VPSSAVTRPIQYRCDKKDGHAFEQVTLRARTTMPVGVSVNRVISGQRSQQHLKKGALDLVYPSTRAVARAASSPSNREGEYTVVGVSIHRTQEHPAILFVGLRDVRSNNGTEKNFLR